MVVAVTGFGMVENLMDDVLGIADHRGTQPLALSGGARPRVLTAAGWSDHIVWAV
ncbi:hypothetical protein [Streptomyces sp. NPDC047070]|uniref:hypothetical protein n=1 Tax=Streptomyces sp. NPDC047070 TaxID=3154923 RepID=UPI0034545D28